MHRTPALLLLALALAGPAAADNSAGSNDGWLATFQNGDTMHCRLVGLAGRRLTVVWEMEPSTPVELDLDKMAEIQRAAPLPKGERIGDEVLRLQNGAVLYGKTERFGPDGITFRIAELGALTFDTDELLALARDPNVELPEEAANDLYVVVTTAGMTIQGQLTRADGGRLELKSDGVVSTIDYDKVDLMAFPVSGNSFLDDDNSEPGQVRVSVQVTMRDGSTLSGRSPAIADDSVRFTLPNKTEVSLRMDQIQGMSFIDYTQFAGRADLRSLVVWTAYADVDDELKKTLAIVDEVLPQWKVEQVASATFGPEFRRQLFRSRTLLVPEMESWSVENPEALARQLRPLAHAFLRSGGNIVFCGVQKQPEEFLRMADLLDVTMTGTVDDKQITMRPNTPLGVDVEDRTWPATNATFGYSVASRAEVIAEAPGGKAVVIARRVGRGWIILLGMDFYAQNQAVKMVLRNAIQLR